MVVGHLSFSKLLYNEMGYFSNDCQEHPVDFIFYFPYFTCLPCAAYLSIKSKHYNNFY